MKNHDIELMEHADGERDHADRLRDPEARAKVEAIGELGELVRGHLELSADAVPAGAVRADLGQGRQGDRDARARARRADCGSKIGSWFERYRGHVVTGVVSAGAVAALALVLRSPHTDETTSPGGRGTTNVTPVSYRPTEIESLDTPGGDSTVFNLARRRWRQQR